MSKRDLIKTKYELLCYGVNCSLDVFNSIRAINPYADSNKSVHSACLQLDDKLLVNTPISESYARNSPYSIQVTAGQFLLCKNNDEICKITIPLPPRWYEKRTSNGTKMYDVLSVHNTNVLALTHYISCYYSSIGKQCLYCSFKPSKIPQLLDLKIRKLDIIETLSEARKENFNYTLALSEGSKNKTDQGAVYFSSILKELSENNIQIKTSVELALPVKKSYIDLLYSSGATSLIVNMEFYDDIVRKKYCPGKGEITTDLYFDALHYAVKLFGNGNVASVLIVGIESINNTLTCARQLLDFGIMPILIPFKPYDNCNLSDRPITRPSDLLLVADEIGSYFRSKNMGQICSSSCISCGACNADYYLYENDV